MVLIYRQLLKRRSKMKKFELTGKEVGLLLEAINERISDLWVVWTSTEKKRKAEEKILSLRRLLSRLTRQLGE
jgi:hypothetical protein